MILRGHLTKFIDTVDTLDDMFVSVLTVVPTVDLQYVSTEDNTADILTKPLRKN